MLAFPVAPVAPQAAALYANSWAVLVGVNEFKSPKVPRLRYAANDVRTVAEALKSLGFPAGNIVTLVDQQATKREIERTLSSVLWRRAGPNDRVLRRSVRVPAPKPTRAEVVAAIAELAGACAHG